MSEDRKLTINNQGIYSVKSRRMTANGILNHRSRLQSSILAARHEMIFWQKEVTRLEGELTEYNKPIINNYLQQMKKEKMQAEAKAQQMLKDFLGHNAYATLQKNGHITFTAKDGLKY